MNEAREKQRETGRLRAERTEPDRMGETGREAVHPAHTYMPCAPYWGHCGEQDSKVLTCRKLSVLRVRQILNK